MAVKLRKPEVNGPPHPEAETNPAPMPLRPIEITGVSVTKQALIQALRIYIPNIANIEAVETGETFLITLAPQDHGAPLPAL